MHVLFVKKKITVYQKTKEILQGVRDIIKKSEEELIYLENKLGLFKKFRNMQKIAGELLLSVENADIAPEIKAKIHEFAEAAK